MKKRAHPERERSVSSHYVFPAVFLCLVLALYGYRHYSSARWLPEGKANHAPSMTVIEVSGAVANPGVFFFDHPPTIAQALDASRGAKGFPGTGLSDEAALSTNRMHTGTLLQVRNGQEGLETKLLLMEAEKRVLFEIPLDLNTVSTEDLLNIPGIGPQTAQAIVAHRRMHGEFASLEALKNVKGIGPKRFRSIKRFLYVKTY